MARVLPRPPFPLNGLQLCLAFLSAALSRGVSLPPLITAPGDYGVRGKVAEFARQVAGPGQLWLFI